MTPAASFSDRLRISRVLAAMTQQELAAAARCGGRQAVCLRTIGAYETGVGDPSCVEIGHLGCALGLHPGWLAFAQDLSCPWWLWDASARGAGYRLRAARMEAGMTQAQLAAAAHTTQAEISNLETGAQQPRLSAVRALAQALQVKPAWLAYWAGPQKES